MSTFKKCSDIWPDVLKNNLYISIIELERNYIKIIQILSCAYVTCLQAELNCCFKMFLVLCVIQFIFTKKFHKNCAS